MSLNTAISGFHSLRGLCRRTGCHVKNVLIFSLFKEVTIPCICLLRSWNVAGATKQQTVWFDLILTTIDIKATDCKPLTSSRSTDILPFVTVMAHRMAGSTLTQPRTPSNLIKAWKPIALGCAINIYSCKILHPGLLFRMSANTFPRKQTFQIFS